MEIRAVGALVVASLWAIWWGLTHSHDPQWSRHARSESATRARVRTSLGGAPTENKADTGEGDNSDLEWPVQATRIPPAWSALHALMKRVLYCITALMMWA